FWKVATRSGLSGEPANGFCIRKITCVNVVPLVFEICALYAMFSPYVTCPGPGTASKVNPIARGPALPAGTRTASALAATTHAKMTRRTPNLIPLPPLSPQQGSRQDGLSLQGC